MTNTISLVVQNLVNDYYVPAENVIQGWLNKGFPECNSNSIVLRIVNANEGQQLNKTWRNKNIATNVLSFPATHDFSHEESGHLGDLVVTAEVLEREAKEFSRDADFHWAHMIIHGVLHLLGYDHQNSDEALEMEVLEEKILARIGFPKPYEQDD